MLHGVFDFARFGLAYYALMGAITVAAALIIWQAHGEQAAIVAFVPMLLGAYMSCVGLSDVVDLAAVPGRTDGIAISSMFGAGVVGLLVVGVMKAIRH